MKNALSSSLEPIRKLARVVTMVLTLCSGPVVHSHQNWDGDNAVGDFSNNDNWYGNSQPAWGFGNGNLYFSYRNNSSQASLYYNYGSWQDTNDIVFEATFGAGLSLNGNGNGLNFNQRLENLSSFTQTINIPLSGAKNGAGQIELNPVNGNLVLNGSLENLNNKSYAVYGTNGKVVTINTALGGNASVGFTVQQNSTASFTAEQTFGGTAMVNAGSIELAGSSGSLTNSGGTTGSSSIVISGGTLLLSGTAANKLRDNATVSLGGGTQTRLAVSGNITETTGALTLASGAGMRVIDFGTSNSALTFSSLSSAATTLPLQIWNWTAGGANQLTVSAGSLGANTVLSDITFFTGAGTGSLGIATFSGNNLVPVPEPAALLAGLALLAPLAWRERRHWMRCAVARG